jgi:hypothetical protein
LLSDIWLTKDGAILDGKVREKACGMAGVEPRFATYEGDDPFGFSISQNARRRHMPHNELAFVVEELANMRQGRPGKNTSQEVFSRVHTLKEVASLSGVSKSSMEDAKAIKRYGASNVIALAKTGQVALRHASAYARHTPKDEQIQADARAITHKGKAISERSKAKSPKDAKPANDKTIAVSTVIEALRPLVRRVKEQSEQHPAMVSQASLAIIASAFKMIFQAWARGDAPEVVTRITRHIDGSYIRDGSFNSNHEYYYNNQATQQRNQGSDP